MGGLGDLRGFLNELRRRGAIREFKEPVAIEEAYRFIRSNPGAVAIFEDVRGYDLKIATGICGSRELIAAAIGIEPAALHGALNEAMRNPLEPGEANSAAFSEAEPDLSHLPIARYYPRDGGPYISSAIVSAKSPDGSIENVSIHRMMVLDRRRLAIRIVPRHLFRLCEMARASGSRSLPIGVAIGLHPSVLLAASSPAPFGVSEYAVANRLMGGGLRLAELGNSTRVPFDAEIAMEGEISLEELEDEGPFVDLTGTYDIVRRQPVVRIDKVYKRDGAIYHALLPGGPEHAILMGLPYEARIREAVAAAVPTVKDVRLTPGGCCWLHAVISIEKQADGDGKNALLAAFAAHPSLKHAVVVDSDIDISDPAAVEWAIATRFQGDRDLIIIRGARGSSLDPSADQESLTTTKLGFDATRPMSKPRDKFLRAGSG
jgi:UbiD family decarboxylase